MSQLATIPRTCRQGYCPIQAKPFVPFLFAFLLNLSEALVLVLCCCLLSLACSFLLELSLPLPSLSCWFSVTFKPAICALFASFLSSSPSCLSFQWRYVEHAQQNGIAQLCASFAVHAHYVPSRQTDTRTNGHTDTLSDVVAESVTF